jgi:hypothetical protein
MGDDTDLASVSSGPCSDLKSDTRFQFIIIILKRFDRGNCNGQGLIVPKSKREGRQDRRKPAVPERTLSHQEKQFIFQRF